MPTKTTPFDFLEAAATVAQPFIGDDELFLTTYQGKGGPDEDRADDWGVVWQNQKTGPALYLASFEFPENTVERAGVPKWAALGGYLVAARPALVLQLIADLKAAQEQVQRLDGFVQRLMESKGHVEAELGFHGEPGGARGEIERLQKENDELRRLLAGRNGAHQPAGEIPVVEVHNAWTIMGLHEDGSLAEQPLAEHTRPQDWGNPRWSYHPFEFRWVQDGTEYVHHFHGWTDLQLEPYQYPELFAQFIVQVLMPGDDSRLCGRNYLAEEDFWDESWGPQPPFIDDEDDEPGE